MKLEEAMKTLLDFIRCAEEEFGKVKYTSTSMNVDDGDIEAISTVLQELDRLQKENEKLEKANKVYINSIQSITPVLLKDYVEKDKIRELISKIDVDIETNDGRMIMYEEEKGTSRYVCKLIAYDPRSVKIILQELLKEE